MIAKRDYPLLFLLVSFDAVKNEDLNFANKQGK
jgi:hypothetical protein